MANQVLSLTDFDKAAIKMLDKVEASFEGSPFGRICLQTEMVAVELNFPLAVGLRTSASRWLLDEIQPYFFVTLASATWCWHYQSKQAKRQQGWPAKEDSNNILFIRDMTSLKYHDQIQVIHGRVVQAHEHQGDGDPGGGGKHL